MNQTYKFILGSIILLSANLQLSYSQFNTYHDVITNGQSDIEDLDFEDGFDFVTTYADQLTIKFGEFECDNFVSNEIVDGGSKTTFNGSEVRLLRFGGDSNESPLVVANTDFESTITLWDRADFGQQIIEFEAQIGESSLIWRLVADSNNGDLAYGKMFEVNSPNFNDCLPNSLPLFNNEEEASQLYSVFEFEITAAANEFGGDGVITGNIGSYGQEFVLFGDVNRDEKVDLLDITPFIERLSSGIYQLEADANYCGVVNLLDVNVFISYLTGQ